MVLEEQPRDALRVRIEAIQRDLADLSERTRSMAAFSGDTVPDPEERELAISPRTTAAGFWNHFIGGSIAAADGSDSPVSLDPDLVRRIQKRVKILVLRWIDHPNGVNQLGGSEVTRVFQTASLSFDWSEHPGLFRELRDCAYALGDVYMGLEGKRSL